MSEIIHWRAPGPDYDVAVMGDNHCGALAEHRDGMMECLEWVMGGKHRYCIHVGDALEAIDTLDPRFYMDAQRNAIPIRQLNEMVEVLRPFRKRILVGLMGNHELKLHRVGDLSAELCRQIEIPYGGYSCRIHFEDKHGLGWKGYFRHGFDSRLVSRAKDYDQRRANMIASLKLKFAELRIPDCHLVACGHYHHVIVVPPARKLIVGDDGERLRQRYVAAETRTDEVVEPDRRWTVCSGSFLKSEIIGALSYPEKMGLGPVELGYAVVEVRDRRIANVREVWV